MRSSSSSTMWTVLGLLICVVVAVAAYLLAIGPELDRASEARAERADAREFNDLLDTQLLQAQATAQEVPTWRGQLAAISIDMPPTPEKSALHTLLLDTLGAHGLPLGDVAYGGGSLVAPGGADALAPAAPAEEATTDATATATPAPTPSAEPTDGAAADPAPAETPAWEGLVGFPVSVSTQGSPTNIMNFIQAIQTQKSRFITVTGVDIKSADEAAEAPGMPPAAPGDWSVNISLMTFSLIDNETSFVTEEPGTNPSYGGSVNSNPFQQ